MKKKILVTGGAGYIGSHTVKELLRKNFDVVVLDNLAYGHALAVDCRLIKTDLLQKDRILRIFKQEKFNGVIHFAAYALAGESMKAPFKYFENNLQGGLNLLEAMRKTNVKHIVFSSTAAIYGFPEKLPVVETAEKKPVSVYGESKLTFEKILAWYDQIYGVKNISLRYFNAAGASLDGKIGEDHSPETHIIPIAMQVALGLRDKFILFGDDYKTKDGTCVRDYIHVVDLAAAHTKALRYLFTKNKSNNFNVGVGKGYSNKQVLEAIHKATKIDFKVEMGSRRKGDPDAIFADNRKIKRVLKWKPMYSSLNKIVSTAWRWHKENPKGFGD